ncbi:unnamed protein product, partial [Prorocentrum cordatum]
PPSFRTPSWNHRASVVLDLFLGGGGTASAMAWGLGRERPRGGRSRPAELFSFEREPAQVRRALGARGGLGAGWRRRLWAVRRRNASSPEDHLRLGAELRRAPVGGALPAVWVLEGRPYPAREGGAARPGYARNPLDLLCAHRAPVDAVLLDPSGATQSLEVEWMIIELACRPRWVLVVNLNLGGGSGASFVKGRLDMLAASVGGWRLEVHGHFLLHHHRG